MRHVIIGGSAAGIACAETIRRHDDKADIILISDEEFPLYSRCLLTYLIAGAIDEDKLCFKDKDFFESNRIEAHLGRQAVSIDREKKSVSLDDETVIAYDKLMIATGAAAKVPEIAGHEKKGVFTLRDIGDARAIISSLDKVKTAAILGGGLIGLRDAYALSQRQKEIIVIVKSPQVLSQMLDKEAAEIIAAKLTSNGISIKTGLAAKEFKGGASVEAILLDDGSELKCELVVVGKGVRPNTQIACSCGLDVKDGIVADEFLRTSDEDIFTAGDVAQTSDIARGIKKVNALWPCAVEQGETAGLNMLGRGMAYNGSLSMNSVDFFGLGTISMGITKPGEEGYEVISKARPDSYKKFVIKNNIIAGMVLVGDVRPAGVVSALIKKRIDISSIKGLLLNDNFDYAKIMPLVARFKDAFSQEEYQETVIGY